MFIRLSLSVWRFRCILISKIRRKKTVKYFVFWQLIFCNILSSRNSQVKLKDENFWNDAFVLECMEKNPDQVELYVTFNAVILCIFSFSTNYSSVTHWRTPDRRLHDDGCTFCRLQCVVWTTLTGPSAPRRCPSMTCSLSLIRPHFTVPCSNVFNSVSCQQIWPDYDSLWRFCFNKQHRSFLIWMYSAGLCSSLTVFSVCWRSPIIPLCYHRRSPFFSRFSNRSSLPGNQSN